MLKPYMYRNETEAGCDEAGRGCLAGPVVAAAVILPRNFRNSLLNDSKQLTKKERSELRPIIMEKALAWHIASVGNTEIDEMNILRASVKAMHLAVAGLTVKPSLLLVDGNRFYPYSGIGHKCVVKGDSIYMSIAAASVLAKTFRDEFMENLAKEFPMYGWDENKGYPTAGHRKAIAQFGITPWHRRSFNLTETQLKINFS